MKNLFDSARVNEVKQRLAAFHPDIPRLWGKMNAPQALAHCSRSFELASGDLRPPRVLIGRILGPFIKPKVFANDDPIRRNSPTVPGLVVLDERDLASERAALYVKIDRFIAAGRSGCTAHPHSFFGSLTPDEWAILMYKHLDHHLRQFGV